MARGKWLEPMWDAVACCREWHRFSDVVALTTDLKRSMLKRKQPASEEVLLEDAFCDIIWRLVLALLAQRTPTPQYHACDGAARARGQGE
jgi:hypothetical protein